MCVCVCVCVCGGGGGGGVSKLQKVGQNFIPNCEKSRSHKSVSSHVNVMPSIFHYFQYFIWTVKNNNYILGNKFVFLCYLAILKSRSPSGPHLTPPFKFFKCTPLLPQLINTWFGDSAKTQYCSLCILIIIIIYVGVSLCKIWVRHVSRHVCIVFTSNQPMVMSSLANCSCYA